MYMGQETWAPGPYGAPQKRKASPAPRGEIGDAAHITLSGCNHGVVGPIVCGNFTLTTINHGKPAYKKEPQPGKPDVTLYFWDERDGAAASGWWLSPKIGSEVVWGYHSNRSAQTPPTRGWKVPYDGGVDPNFQISSRRGVPQSVGKGFGKGKPGKDGSEGPRRKFDDQRRRMEDVRRDQADRRQLEGQQRKAQQEEKLQEERRAVAVIRQVLQKVQAVQQEEKLEALAVELRGAMGKELDNCGSQKVKLKDECDRGLSQARDRVGRIKEEEAIRKKAQEKSDKLLEELEKLVAAAETAAASVKEASGPVANGSEPTSSDDLSAVASSVEEAGAEVRSKSKACSEFIAAKGAELKGPRDAKAKEKGKRKGKGKGKDKGKASKAGVQEATAQDAEESLPDAKLTFADLKKRLRDCERGAEATISSVKAAQERLVNKVAADALQEQRDTIFRKYDSDKDGALSRKEIAGYAKGEYSFVVPAETLDRIFEVFVEAGAKGVMSEDFQRVRIAVGIAREKERDAERRVKRLARDEELKGLKADLEKIVAGVSEEVDALSESVSNVADQEQEGLMPAKDKSARSEAMLKHAASMDGLMKVAKEKLTATKEAIQGLRDREVAAELKRFLLTEAKKLDINTTTLDQRITKASAWLKRFRGEAKKLASQELEAVRTQARSALRRHQASKGLKTEALFAELAGGSGPIDEAKFTSFFSGLAKEAEAEATEGEGGSFPADDLPSLFSQIADDGKGISREAFERFTRICKRVIKDTVITENLAVNDSKVLRRIELNEVVEVIEGPEKDAGIGVMRVRAKAVSDEATGWITVAGNQQSVYLKDGGDVYKVLKESLLTDSFDLGDMKEESGKLYDTTRKLAVGEIVEVHEWPKKDEQGLTRMKCRARSDGQIGWVTTVGNQGGVFLEMA